MRQQGLSIVVVVVSALASGCSLDRVTLGGAVPDAGPNAYQCSCLCSQDPVAREVSVSSSEDDAEELLSTGAVNLTSTDLELTEEAGPQQVGLRFRDLGLPPGAVITSARVQFVADQASTVVTELVIHGEAADSAAAFLPSLGNLSGRARTAASVAWSPGPWNLVGEVGPAQQTPDLSALLQEVVNRPGYTPDSAVVLLISGSGHRVASSFDLGAGTGPRLWVEFQEPSVEVALNACAPGELNPNDGGSGLTAASMAADCEGRVESTVRGLAGACGYPATCQCAVVPMAEPVFAATCDQPCVGEEVTSDCSNFNPEVEGGVTATHAGSDAPVCITASPLSAGMFGQRSECQVSGTATLVAEEETRTTAAQGMIEFSGGPCAGGGCEVGVRYRMRLAPVTYETLFASATFEDLAGTGHSLHGAEAVLSASGDGVFGPGELFNSVRGRRGSEALGLVGSNGAPVDFTLVGGAAPSCSLGGALVGNVDPELRRCEPAGPSASQLCSEDADCVDHEDCAEGSCECLPVSSAGVTLSLAVSGALVNQRPTTHAGADQTVECNLAGRARLALTSRVQDPDGNLAQVSWRRGSRTGPVVGTTPVTTVEQAVGTPVLYVVRAIDTRAQSDEDSSLVQVVDTTPPRIECNAPATIAPPDPRLRFSATASDVCDAVVVPEITSVRCFRINPAGKEIDLTHACGLEVDGHSLTVNRTLGMGHRMEWTLRAFDDAGNLGTRTCQVLVVRP